jgi:hypothetical protein
MDEAGIAIRRHADATARLSAAVQANTDADLVYDLKRAVQKWSEASRISVQRYESHEASHTSLPSRTHAEGGTASSGSRRSRSQKIDILDPPSLKSANPGA